MALFPITNGARQTVREFNLFPGCHAPTAEQWSGGTGGVWGPSAGRGGPSWDDRAWSRATQPTTWGTNGELESAGRNPSSADIIISPDQLKHPNHLLPKGISMAPENREILWVAGDYSLVANQSFIIQQKHHWIQQIFSEHSHCPGTV